MAEAAVSRNTYKMRFSFLNLLFPLTVCRAASLLHHEHDPPFDPFHLGHPDQQQQQQQQVLSLDRPARGRGFVALGDSYSAGIGTGLDGDLLTSEGDCRHGQHGYPLLMHVDLNNHTKTNTSLQWLSCTGAVTTDLLAGVTPASQIDALNTSLPLDFATLSIGGNDLGFFDVMNACIFRFYSFYSGTCEAALAASDAAVQSDVFEQRLAVLLQEVLDRVGWERRPGFHITVTGYARFFNAETPECDDMSLGVWWGGPKLSRHIRTRMNQLVVAANAKLRRTVALVNSRFRVDDDDDDSEAEKPKPPRVVFVDYDTLFEGHRFCEPGVAEPAYDRTESWFFLVGGPDNARNETTWPNGTNGDPEGTRTMMGAAPGAGAGAGAGAGGRYQRHGQQQQQQQQLLLPPTSELVDPETCLARAQRHRGGGDGGGGGGGDWGELALCYMAMARSRDPSLRPAYGGVVPLNGMWWVPTYYGKTFHPRSLGCDVIRDRIYETWEEYGLAGL